MSNLPQLLHEEDNHWFSKHVHRWWLLLVQVILDKTSKENIYRSAKNIPHVKVTDVNHFSAFDIAKFQKIIFTESSIKELEKRFS